MTTSDLLSSSPQQPKKGLTYKEETAIAYKPEDLYVKSRYSNPLQ